jgi:ATP-binding cassette subfamily B protein
MPRERPFRQRMRARREARMAKWDRRGKARADAPRLDRQLMGRIFAYFLPYWRRALLVLACIVVGAGLGLAPALITRTLIDFLAHPHPDFGRLALIVGAGVGATVLAGLVGVLQALLTTTISQSIMYDVRQQLFRGMMRQSIGFFTRSRTGDLMSRVSNDVGGIDTMVSDTVFGSIQGVIVTITTLGLMLRLSWPLTLAALALMPIVLVPTRIAGRVNYRARRRLQEKMGEVWAYMQDILNISGIMLVKAFTKERSEEQRFSRLSGELRGLQVRTAIIQRWFNLFGSVFQASGPALLLLLGGYLVLTGNATVGTLVSVVMILGTRLTGAIGSLAGIHVNVMGGLALFQRVFQYLDLPVAITDREDAHVLGSVRGAVKFDHVTFTYPEAPAPALDDISFSVEPGQLVALVGPSGAGKTTATHLVARLYDPTSGCVRVDGRDVRDVALESLSSHIGVVFQDTFLFHATVRDNLLYARPDATEADMVAAARAAQIHEYVSSLPDGYDTVVGERGHRLSGGEKQRLAIARVILRDPRIVILDEATSNLDTLSEQLIQAALQPLFAGRTSFVIAHRLSTIMAADAILVLQEGRLVETGTHTDLLSRGGLYRRLCEHQFDLNGAATA